MAIPSPSINATFSQPDLENSNTDRSVASPVMVRGMMTKTSAGWGYWDGAITAAAATVYQSYIDDFTTTNVTYFGKSVPLTADSAAGWQIYAFDETGNFLNKGYADGVTAFTKVWDDRVSFTY